MVEIERVREDWQAEAVERLAWEFVGFLRDRYPDMKAQIDGYLAAQDFANRMRDVRRDYGPPNGECLLALSGGEPVGILMMRDLGDGSCEMNRMFVRPSARGQGVGGKLLEALIAEARALGYGRMKLGALPRHYEALSLYRRAGFVDDPGAALAGGGSDTVRMSLDLAT